MSKNTHTWRSARWYSVLGLCSPAFIVVELNTYKVTRMAVEKHNKRLTTCVQYSALIACFIRGLSTGQDDVVEYKAPRMKRGTHRLSDCRQHVASGASSVRAGRSPFDHLRSLGDVYCMTSHLWSVLSICFHYFYFGLENT